MYARRSARTAFGSAIGVRTPKMTRSTVTTSPELPEFRLARELLQRRLAAELLRDLRRERGTDDGNPGDVPWVGLLQVAERVKTTGEQRAGPHAADPAELDQVQQLLPDPVLDPQHQAGDAHDLLLVEDLPELGHRVHQPHALVHHPADVPRADAELLRHLVLRPLVRPVLEQGRGLYLGHHELVLLDRERHRLRGDLVLDPSVVPASEVQLRHVRGRARRPEVVEVRVSVVFESVPHLHRAQRVDVQVARPAAEERRSKRTIASLEEILPLEEREDVLDLPTKLVHRALVGEERTTENSEQLLLRRRVPRRDRREGVYPEGGLGAELRLHGLGWAEEVLFDEVINIVIVLRNENRLPRLVVLGTARSAAHLFHFQDGNRSEAEVHVKAIQVADYHPPRGGIHPIRQRRCRDDALDPSPSKLRLDEGTLLVREACVVKCRAPIDTPPESRRHRGRFFLPVAESLGELVQSLGVL